jgi:transposase
MPAKRTRQTKEYKLEAVRLATTSGKSMAAVAQELGIRVESLYRWKRELEIEKADAFRGNGVLRSADDEVARLRRELKRVTEERDFLKKTAQFFAKESK